MGAPEPKRRGQFLGEKGEETKWSWSDTREAMKRSELRKTVTNISLLEQIEGARPHTSARTFGLVLDSITISKTLIHAYNIT